MLEHFLQKKDEEILLSIASKTPLKECLRDLMKESTEKGIQFSEEAYPKVCQKKSSLKSLEELLQLFLEESEKKFTKSLENSRAIISNI